MKTLLLKSFVVAFTATICLLFVSLVTAQESSTDESQTDWRAMRKRLERQYGEELQDIANWCRENNAPQQVDATLEQFVNRDLSRQYIYLPNEEAMPTAPKGLTDKSVIEWLEKVNQARVKHADRIFALAQKAADADAGAVAFQLLNEAVCHNRDHAEARKILGHSKSETGWNVTSDRIRVRVAKRQHDVIQWPGSSYIRVTTSHFEIESNASEERVRYLAEQLERWHPVWRQVFFEYWSTPSAVKKWIAGKGSARNSSRKFRVVFLKNKADYDAQLERVKRGISVSTGYYSPENKISFFYDGDAEVQATWRHELTHQLFRESGRAKGNNFETQFIWLDEGIATYFESLADFGDYVTLGGFDSRRVQYARVRKLLENFPITMQELSSLGRAGLQSHPEQKRLYSVAAGLTEMLMNDENGAHQKSLVQFLNLIHKKRVKAGAFEKIMKRSFANWDARYPEFLKIDSKHVERFLSKPESRRELALPAAGLKLPAYEAISQCVNLQWLDISQNTVTLQQLATLKTCTKIHQLIMTNCSFEKDSLRALELFPQLDEVDLSASSVQDFQLTSFRNLKKLRSLQLISTAITDRGLMELANVPNLQVVNVTGTRVTDQGIANLKARRPNMVITK
ncbi:MAG: leucine-rich repeat domain-containing protein [Mariniblastus sp.]